MKTELETMGLWPGSIPVRNLMKMVSLWRFPPQPELIDSIADFPSPKYFQLHPFFIWKPENDNLMGRLRNNEALPCIGGCAHPQVTEGLTHAKMDFKDFVETEFFHRELEATRQRVEERAQHKRKRADSQPTGTRKCRFCKLDLKQGPESPHIHTGFPGVAGKYIYCPAKVFSLYKDKGLDKEMTWREFQESPFFELEKQRWEAEKAK